MLIGSLRKLSEEYHMFGNRTNRTYSFGNPGTGLEGIIVSIYNLGCFTGCILTFILGEKLGRRCKNMSRSITYRLSLISSCSMHVDSYGLDCKLAALKVDRTGS